MPYRIYRPSPLCRAYNLEKALGTPAKIYYKFEGNTSAWPLNPAIAQAITRRLRIRRHHH